MNRTAVCFNYKLTEQVLAAWFDLFGQEQAADFDVAMKLITKEIGRKFFPIPSDVEEKLSTIKKPDLASTAQEIWERLVSYAKQSKAEIDVLNLETDDSIHRAIKEVTWDKIRYSDIDKDLPYVRAAFIKAYNAFKQNAEVRLKIEGANSQFAIGQKAREVIGL